MKKVLYFTLTIVLFISLLPSQANAAQADFKDVPKSHQNYVDIMFLLDKGIISGGTNFGVNDKVTREEVAVMVAKAIGLDGKKIKTKFKDVSENRYSSGFINSAVQAGIINGYLDGTFRPNNLVTRGHMAAFIERGFKLTNQADISFKDVPEGSTSYIAVKKLAYSNITTGYPDGTFKPNESLSRAHISTFLARAMRGQKTGTDVTSPSLTDEELAVKYLIDSGEYYGTRTGLFIFPISRFDRVIEISIYNNQGNPYLNRWLFKEGKIVDKLWYGTNFNDNYTSNPLLGGIVSPIKNPTTAPVSPPNIKGVLELYGQDGKFLGVLTTNKYAVDSVFNQYGTYGSKYSSTSIWNPYSTYGSEYSSTSAFNKYSNNAPRVVLDGEIIGYVTANPYTFQDIHPNNLYDVLISGGF